MVKLDFYLIKISILGLLSQTAGVLWDFCTSRIHLTYGPQSRASLSLWVSHRSDAAAAASCIEAPAARAKAPFASEPHTPKSNTEEFAARTGPSCGGKTAESVSGVAAGKTVAASCLVKAEKRGAAHSDWETQGTIFPGAGAS